MGIVNWLLARSLDVCPRQSEPGNIVASAGWTTTGCGNDVEDEADPCFALRSALDRGDRTFFIQINPDWEDEWHSQNENNKCTLKRISRRTRRTRHCGPSRVT